MLPGTVADWLARIERLHPQSIAMGLERVAAVRARLLAALPFAIITVGGTNGKGSTCAMLEAILRQAGYRTGCYTSPHLVSYNERVRIDGADIVDAALLAAFERVETARTAGAEAVPLTYFEFGTLAAATAFVEAGVDVAVMEVGLGGRLDAVNVFDADLAILASVDLDHMDYLGNTREQIGWEKAHIFRGGRPAICAEPRMPQTVVDHARQIGARLLAIGRDFGFEAADRTGWRYWGPGGGHSGLPYPALRGAHQLGNAAACIAALDCLRERLPVTMQDVRTGLLAAEVAGRFQVLPGRPTTVLDVAHNPHAAQALAANLAAMPRHRQTLAVCGMLRDKDVGGVIAPLGPHVDRWYVASTPGPRGLAAEALAGAVRAAVPGACVTEFAAPTAAYAAGCTDAGEDDRILVFGSFITVGEVMRERARRGAATPR